MRKFKFSEFDAVGEGTLQAIGGADRFNNWMYQTIRPWCRGEILEIGSGAGNISKYFLKDNLRITLTDIRTNYCENLQKKFTAYPSFAGIQQINLADKDFEKKHAGLLGTFDTVFALNVVEHIEDDSLAVSNSHKLLKPGGNLIILVPAFETLYNKFDYELGHYRRYTKSSLIRLFEANNLKVIHNQYFNFAGILGWFVSGKILRNKIIPVSQVNLFNALVPLFKVADRVLFSSVGLSTIAVGRK